MSFIIILINIYFIILPSKPFYISFQPKKNSLEEKLNFFQESEVGRQF
jgi:hypothetical protein